jgi:hypothetical protein
VVPTRRNFDPVYIFDVPELHKGEDAFRTHLTVMTVNETGCALIIYFLISFAPVWGASLSTLTNLSGVSGGNPLRREKTSRGGPNIPQCRKDQCVAPLLSGVSPLSASGRANSSRNSAHPCRLPPDQPQESALFRLCLLGRLVT